MKGVLFPLHLHFLYMRGWPGKWFISFLGEFCVGVHFASIGRYLTDPKSHMFKTGQEDLIQNLVEILEFEYVFFNLLLECLWVMSIYYPYVLNCSFYFCLTWAITSFYRRITCDLMEIGRCLEKKFAAVLSYSCSYSYSLPSIFIMLT